MRLFLALALVAALASPALAGSSYGYKGGYQDPNPLHPSDNPAFMSRTPEPPPFPEPYQQPRAFHVPGGTIITGQPLPGGQIGSRFVPDQW